jgi:hypothetical protein
MSALQQCTSVHDVMETLANFPPRIQDVYRLTWKRIVEQSSNGGLSASNPIIWVLNSPKSMTVPELQHASAVSLETHEFEPSRVVHKDTLVGQSRGLLVVDEETTLVRLVRKFFPCFL